MLTARSGRVADLSPEGFLMTDPVLTANWSYPTRIWAGPGRIADLAGACGALKLARPLLITDAGLRDSPMVRDALSQLTEAGLQAALFADVRGNPVGANVEAGVGVYNGHAADGVIAFGGGSALDAAKAVALMAKQSLPIWDFEDVGTNWKRADASAIAPVIAVPTTAGTGSEVGRAAVIVNEETEEKKIIFHPDLLPKIVISDPELTVGLPADITAATGLDAYTHCFEAFSATAYHPMADGLALEGMRRIAAALPRAYADGTDIAARADLLTAASMGAAAFQKGLGAVHGLAHPIGALFDTHHGLTNAVLLPYVMRHNEAALKDKAALLGRILNLAQADFTGLMDWTLRFRERHGIPHTLTDIGVDADATDRIAEMAMRDPSTGGNPIEMTQTGYTQILQFALQGRL
jgi:alcohol dehydrogenase class IV